MKKIILGLLRKLGFAPKSERVSIRATVGPRKYDAGYATTSLRD